MPQADSKKSSTQELQQTAQMTTYPQHFEDDTIDFYELFISLWNRKWVVIALTVVVALGSILYSLRLQNIYKAEALLLPPKAKDIQSLNVLGLQNTVDGKIKVKFGNEINEDVVFTKFKKNLTSRNLHKKFIQEYGLMQLLAPERTSETRDNDIFAGFTSLIKLGDKNGSTSLSIQLHDADIAAQWVNDLIEFVDKETIAMLVDDVRNVLKTQIRDIEYTIASKRLMAKKRREDQIVRYTEHAEIAKKLGMIRRVDATNVIQNTQMNVDIATATTPLYYLGFEALMTEINILHNRKSDDPFISGLRDLQEQLGLLRTIKVDEEKTSAVNIDQAAYPPNSPLRPNRRYIVSIATVCALFSGIFLVLFIEFIQNQRKKHSG